MDKLSQILLTSSSASDALRVLYEHQKAVEPGLSLEDLGRKIGIPSKGNLSQIMNGKRPLPRKKVQAICHFFNFNYMQSKLFTLKVEKERRQSEANKIDLEKHINKIEQNLITKQTPNEQNVLTVPMAMEVFSAFGLFESHCTFPQLLQFFGEGKRRRIMNALEELMKVGYVEQLADGSFRLTSQEVMIRSDRQEQTMQRMIENSLSDAGRNLKNKFTKSNESIFLSSIISLSQAHLERLIPKIRNELESMQSELEEDSGDTLVRFNFQMYTVGKSKRTD